MVAAAIKRISSNELRPLQSLFSEYWSVVWRTFEPSWMQVTQLQAENEHLKWQNIEVFHIKQGHLMSLTPPLHKVSAYLPLLLLQYTLNLCMFQDKCTKLFVKVLIKWIEKACRGLAAWH